jgi:hypothetical protein
MMVFLVCSSIIAYDNSFSKLQQTILNYNIISAIIFSTTQFQYFVATNFLLALAEQVIVEQLDISKVFPGVPTLSSHLRQHTKVILMIRDNAYGMHNLLITQFTCVHTKT